MQMKRLFSMMLVLACVALNAQIQPTLTVRLYPQGQNTDLGIVENGVALTLGPGESNGLTGPEECAENGNISNINDEARLDIYIPAECNGQMVINCPGGGYLINSSYNEGSRAADWFAARGIACCVVKYRIPNQHRTVPLTDVQNAFRYCRAHAAEWGVRQIGVMGYSAGGHLAGSASTMFVDQVTRPDFSVLVYPVITMEQGVTHNGTMRRLTAEDPALREYYSLENRVGADTPKTLLMLSADDNIVAPENSLRYYRKLLEHKVSSEIHIFTSGGHGWGFSTSQYGKDELGDAQRAEFFTILERWLSDRRAEIGD